MKIPSLPILKSFHWHCLSCFIIGTDSLQRHSLEPLLMSIANVDQTIGELHRSWRHLGFVPANKEVEKNSSLESLQFYHKCLFEPLKEIKECQRNPPAIGVWINGLCEKRRAFSHCACAGRPVVPGHHVCLHEEQFWWSWSHPQGMHVFLHAFSLGTFV